jgi:HTH-type transcriptional regulator, competence development regulator
MSDLPESTLGSELRRIREFRGATLKSVAEPAGISAAYLLKLERDVVQSPSPHVLRRLADCLDISYLKLMALAGYEISDDHSTMPRVGVLADALAAESLDESEQRAVAAFLTALRAQKDRLCLGLTMHLTNYAVPACWNNCNAVCRAAN